MCVLLIACRKKSRKKSSLPIKFPGDSKWEELQLPKEEVCKGALTGSEQGTGITVEFSRGRASL